MYSSRNSPNLLTLGFKIRFGVKFTSKYEAGVSICWNVSEIGFWSKTKQTFDLKDFIIFGALRDGLQASSWRITITCFYGFG